MTPTTQLGERVERVPHILLWGLLGVVLVGVVALGAWSLVRQDTITQLLPGAPSARLPVYGTVPDFGLIDQRGRAVRRADLEGKIWVASLIFTSCPDECPLMTAELAQLQSDLASIPDLRFVSISVDPERDTPALLSQYADRFNADPERWLFLTGDKRAIYQLAREGFRLGVVDPTEQPQSSPINSNPLGTPRRSLDQSSPSFQGRRMSGWSQTFRGWLRYAEPSMAFADHDRAKDTLHSTRFVLVDRHAQIRGYYDSREEADLQRLRQHLQILLRET
jgi:cytochrome oxidase Cu insertion factor (SCO1/SenC/PrrC family)